MKKKNLLLSLNKEVIDQLDRVEQSNIKGGGETDFITTILGSNCNNSDPNAHECCTGEATVSGACISYTSRYCGDLC